MSKKIIDRRKENLREELNHLIFKLYGSKISLTSLEEVKKGKFLVHFSYNRVFQIVDDNQKKIFVRNIRFENIYSAEIGQAKDLKIPINEVNKNIKDQFLDLSQHLLHHVINNKEIVLRILHNVPTAAHFLNRFITILTELAHGDVVPKKLLDQWIDSDRKYEKYIRLIISTGLAEYTGKKNLKASNKLKNLLKNNKEDIRGAVEEGVYLVLNKHYDYIIHELGTGHVRAYLDIVASMIYVNERLGIDNSPIDIYALQSIHEKIFGKVTQSKFSERINALVNSGVFERNEYTVRLAATV